MDPINYSSAFTDLPNPGQSFVDGLKTGAGIQALQLQQAQQQANVQRSQMMQKMAAQVAANPTPQAIAQLSIAFPEMSEQFKRSYDMMTPVQQQADLSHMTQVYAAAQNGRPDLAAQLLRDRATALTNSGDTQKAQAASTMADWVEQHPDSFKTSTGVMLASVLGPDKFASAFKNIGEEQRATQQAPFDLAKKQADAQEAQAKATVANATVPYQVAKPNIENQNLLSQIQERMARLGLDRDKLTSETQVKLTELNQKFGQLPDDARKLVNESAMAATGGEQALHQYADLANKIDQLSGSWGAFNTAGEFLKKSFGNEDARSALQKEYTRMATQGVLKLLPPGPASDKDIALAREGVPAATAAPEVMAGYLRGMAKLSSYDAALNNAKAEWAGAVQHLGRTKNDVVIDGIKVPAGTTFNEFARHYVQKKADETYNGAVVQRRSYMRFAQPGGQ